VWLQTQGLDAAQISVVLAGQMAVRIGSGPAFAFLADRMADRRLLLSCLSAAAFVCMALLAVVSGFVAILCLAVAMAVVWTPILPLIEALAVRESEDGGADYGRTRLWGSLTFIVGSVGGGYAITYTGPELIIWFLVAAYLLMLAASFVLPSEQHRKEAAAVKLRFRDVLPVLRHPVFLAFLCSASLIQASHALYYGFGTIHWQDIGIGDAVIGGLWAVGVIAEVILFVFSRRSLALAGPLGLIIVGGAAAAARWWLTALDPSVAWLVLIQSGHALTFGATHLGAMHFIARATPGRYHATVQGIHAAFAGGIIMAVVMSGSGALYASFGADGYLAMAGLGAVGAVFAAIAAMLWNGRPLERDQFT
jgi:PPP family 3-phenylpropionic acid transporter